MEGPDPARDPAEKIGQVRSNLRAWHPLDWLVFWIAVPALLFVVYALPQAFKDRYLVLDTQFPWRLQTWLLSSYTHSQFYPHLIGNVAFYLVVLGMIFAFEHDRRRFRVLAGWSFLAVPVLSSGLTIALWGAFGRNTTGQGFSAVIGAFLAYAMFLFVLWSVEDRMAVFDDPSLFPGSPARYHTLRILLGIALALIVVMGVISGTFTEEGGAVSNGIAHFGGFISGLALLLLMSLKKKGWSYFDTILGTSILVGILWYAYYLFILVRFVRSA